MIGHEFAGLLLAVKTVRSLSAPVPVSTLTTLLAFTDLGAHHSALLFAVMNLSETESVNVKIDTSEDGVHPDDYRSHLIVAPPGMQASLEIGPILLRRYFRLAAYTTSPAFPTAYVQWTVRGVTR